MKTTRITFFVLILFAIFLTPLWAQSLEELLNRANEISNLNYARSLSSLSGITNVDMQGKGGVVLSTAPTFVGTGTMSVEISKSLSFNTTLSNNGVNVSLKFEPFKYEELSNEFLKEHLSKKIKLKFKVIDLFFDAMKRQRKINQLTSESTALQNQAEIALETSAYDYDVEALNTLLKTKIGKLEFPKLNVPKLPERYTPYRSLKNSKRDSTLSLGVDADFSTDMKLEAFLNYSWNPTDSNSKDNTDEDLLDVQKRKYFRDIHILSSIVEAYDKHLSKLFEKYSDIYGKYLDGKATSNEVNDISRQISITGYSRDIYCIQLLKEWYFYTYFGE
jgi:hypothetical protein